VCLRRWCASASARGGGQPVPRGVPAGITADEIDRVSASPNAPGWDSFERALLTAVDELHDDACITDRTWETLASRYDDRQMIELPMLVGQYHMLAFALNSIGVQREPGVPDLPDPPAY